MRVLMLGWEFPPYISGGLGTACYGLTKALSQQNVEVLFVLPEPVDSSHADHVRLLSPKSLERHELPVVSVENLSWDDDLPVSPREVSLLGQKMMASSQRRRGAQVQVHRLGLLVGSGYGSARVAMNRPMAKKTAHAQAGLAEQPQEAECRLQEEAIDPHRPMSVLSGSPGSFQSNQLYHGDLMTESRRYAQLCVCLAQQHSFDAIHAHDWMTYPAGIAVAALTGKPLVVHVHSTEFDRSGDHVNQQVYDIERQGMLAADKVIAVSHLTRKILTHRYGVAADKVEVVYNGIEVASHEADPFEAQTDISRKDKIVLYLGRITMQKGPEYFIGAAKKVLEKVDRVKFVIAGTGDKIRDIIDLAASEGIGHKVLFTGFLRKADVARIFEMADVYVMPSVSEPFGIAPLEAISHDVPVIISKTSGVAEVLTHVLKVDFWDTREMANKIIAVLRHPPLANMLRQHADMEIRRLTWTGAAQRCRTIYQQMIEP